MNWIYNLFSFPAFFVGIGGAIGCIFRYGIGCWISHLTMPFQVPLATTLVNVLGSLILGLVAGCVNDRAQWLYLLLGVGFCGGFTTFSTFSLEIVEHLQSDRIGLAMMECVSNVVLGVGALYVGLWLCKT